MKCKYPYRYAWISMNNTTLVTNKTARIGEVLLDYRRKNGMSRSELAREANEYAKQYGTKVTVQDLYNYEVYGYSPKTDKLTALCKVTGFSYRSMCGYKIMGRKMVA